MVKGYRISLHLPVGGLLFSSPRLPKVLLPSFGLLALCASPVNHTARVSQLAVSRARQPWGPRKAGYKIHLHIHPVSAARVDKEESHDRDLAQVAVMCQGDEHRWGWLPGSYTSKKQKTTK